MSDKCEHNWTEPPECPACVINERDRLLAANEGLRQMLADANRGAERNAKINRSLAEQLVEVRRQLAALEHVHADACMDRDMALAAFNEQQKQLAARGEALGPFALAFDAAEEAKRRGGSATLTGATNLTFDIEFGGEVLHRVTVHDFRNARAVLKGAV